MENQEHKAKLEECVKINYNDDQFLEKFYSKAKGLLPPHESETSNQKSNENKSGFFDEYGDYFLGGEGRKYVEYGAIIGGVGGGLILGGLCVSALGAGVILSAPIIIPVVAGVAGGVAVGVAVGVVAGTIIKNAKKDNLHQGKSL